MHCRGSACGHAEPRPCEAAARHQRQFAPGVGPRRQWKKAVQSHPGLTSRLDLWFRKNSTMHVTHTFARDITAPGSRRVVSAARASLPLVTILGLIPGGLVLPTGVRVM